MVTRRPGRVRRKHFDRRTVELHQLGSVLNQVPVFHNPTRERGIKRQATFLAHASGQDFLPAVALGSYFGTGHFYQLRILRGAILDWIAPFLLAQVFGSSQDLMDNMAVHIGQAIVATGMVKCQAFVVEAQAVQPCGLQVVNVNRRFDHMESEFVGGPEAHARANAAAS